MDPKDRCPSAPVMEALVAHAEALVGGLAEATRRRDEVMAQARIEFAAVQADAQALRTHNDAVKSDRDRFQARLAATIGELHAARQELERHEARLEAAEHELMAVRRRHEASEAARFDLEARLAAAARLAEERAQLHEEVTASLEIRSEALAESERVCAELAAQRDEALRSCADAGQRLDVALRLHDDVDATLAETSAANEDLRERLEQSERAREELEAELRSCWQEIESHRDHARVVAEAGEERERLLAELAARDTEVKMAESRLESVLEELDTTRKTLDVAPPRPPTSRVRQHGGIREVVRHRSDVGNRL